MGSDGGVSPVQEYQALREELAQSKRYVFERPLLIAAGGMASLSAAHDTHAGPLSALLVAILTFNLWFTVNRLWSSAHIVAYIQVELEERSHGRWVGWETCLRHYRRWTKQDRKQKERLVDAQIDREAAPDSLMYYPAILLIHAVLIVFTTAVPITLAVTSDRLGDLSYAFFTAAIGVGFAAYAIKHRPGRMRLMVERNRVIWTNVFLEMQKEGAK